MNGSGRFFHTAPSIASPYPGLVASLLTLSLLTLSLLAMCLLVPVDAARAQSEPTDIAVARFLVDIDGLESGFPEDQEASGLVPRAIRARQNVRIARDAVQTLRTLDGTPVQVAFDSLFSVVAEELRALDLHVLPADTLRGAVPYLLGFPMGSARAVIADGPHAHALEIEIDVTVPDQGTGYWAVLGTGRSTTKGRPEMYLRVRYADAQGLEWREKVRVRSKEKVELSERWLLGVRTDRDVPDASSLVGLTRIAAQRIVEARRDA